MIPVCRNTSVIGPSLVRETQRSPSDSGRQGILSRCTCIRTCKHGAACSLQLAAESSNWVNETPSLLTHVQTHARRCKRTVCTQVSYMRNASVASEFLFPPSTSAGRIDILPRRAVSFPLSSPPPAREYPRYFCGRSNSVILHSTASCNRECKRDTRSYRSYLSP